MPFELGTGLTSTVIRDGQAAPPVDVEDRGRRRRHPGRRDGNRVVAWRADHWPASASSASSGSRASSPTPSASATSGCSARSPRAWAWRSRTLAVRRDEAPADRDRRARRRAGHHQRGPAGPCRQLDMQAMYEVVGDKIQEIFDAQVVDIGIVRSRSRRDPLPVHDRAWRPLPRRADRHPGAARARPRRPASRS